MILFLITSFFFLNDTTVKFSTNIYYSKKSKENSVFFEPSIEFEINHKVRFKQSAVFKIGESSQYPIIKWEDLIAGDWVENYMSYSTEKINLMIGRWKEAWTYSPRYSLILNDTLPPRDGLRFTYSLGNFSFEYILSFEYPYVLPHEFIERGGGDTLEEGEIIHRSLIGHKIEWDKEKYGIYFAEIAYCASTGYFPNPKYLNPLFIYFLLQFNNARLDKGIGTDANILWDFGFYLKFYQNTMFYGELLIDDFSYRKISTNEPPQIGFLLGLNSVIRNIKTIVEYTRVYAWTYLHENPWERYETLGYPIGHPYGPDFDNIFIGLRKYLVKNFFIVDFDFSYLRKGEPTLATYWPLINYGGEWKEFPPNSEFLWGTIETATSYKIGFKLLKSSVEINTDIGYNYYKNYNHESGTTKKFISVFMGIKYKY